MREKAECSVLLQRQQLVRVGPGMFFTNVYHQYTYTPVRETEVPDPGLTQVQVLIPIVM